jgi:hypothetical protein
MGESKHYWENKNMRSIKFKNVFLLSLFVTFLSFTLIMNVLADTGGNAGDSGSNTTQQTTNTLQNPLKVSSLGSLINTGVMIFTYLVVLGAVIAFIIVGLKYIMARGNPTKITEATRWLWNIIIGVAIVIGARVIIQIVINTLTSTGTLSTEVTQSANNALTGQKLNP